MRALSVCLAAAGIFCGGLAAAAAAQQPAIDDQAVESACGAVDREAAAGRAPLTDPLACGFVEAARQFNAQMPLRIDDITTVESVAAVGTQFVYNVRLDVDAAAVTDEMRRNLGNGVLAYVCDEAEMRSTIASGASYRYRWADRSGRPFHEQVIDRC